MTVRASFGVSNGYAPSDGPKALPMSFNITSQQTFNFDLFLEEVENNINNIQSVWIDNSASSQTLTLTFTGGPGQVISVKGNSVGCYPVIAIDPLRATLQAGGVASATINLIFLNVPMPYFSYQAV